MHALTQALVERVARNCFRADRNPDAGIGRARGFVLPPEAAQSDAVTGSTVNRVEGVDGFSGRSFAVVADERGQFEIIVGEFRDDSAGSHGRDGLCVAAPSVVAGVNPALQGFDPGVVYREIPHCAVLARLSFNHGHGSCSERPERQAKSNPQNHRQNHAKLAPYLVCIVSTHDVLLLNRDQRLPKAVFFFRYFLAALLGYPIFGRPGGAERGAGRIAIRD